MQKATSPKIDHRKEEVPLPLFGKSCKKIANFAVAKFENSPFLGLYVKATWKASKKKNWVPKSKTQEFMGTFPSLIKYFEKFAKKLQVSWSRNLKIPHFGVCTLRPHRKLHLEKKNLVPKSKTQEFIGTF